MTSIPAIADGVSNSTDATPATTHMRRPVRALALGGVGLVALGALAGRAEAAPGVKASIKHGS